MKPNPDKVIPAIAEALETLAAGIGEIQETEVKILSEMADAAQASEESSKHQAQTNDVLRAISNELMHLRADLNRFIDSAPRLNSDIRRRLSEIEAKIAGTGG